MTEAATGSAPLQPAPQPAAPAAPAAPSVPTPWHSTFDDETRGWIENRGLHAKKSEEALGELVKTARSAEKKFGVPQERLLTLPANFDEEGALNPVYDRLGRPAKPEDYGLAAPDSDDALGSQFAANLSKVFHGAGLNPTQAKAIFKAIDESASKIYEDGQAATAEAKAASLAGLQKEWGETYNMNVLIAQEAVKAVGASKEEIEALTSALGSDGAVVKFFNRLGQKRSGEAPFVSSDNPAIRYGATTPEAARSKLAELKTDQTWAKEFIRLSSVPGGDASALMKEYRALVAIAAQ